MPITLYKLPNIVGLFLFLPYGTKFTKLFFPKLYKFDSQKMCPITLNMLCLHKCSFYHLIYNCVFYIFLKSYLKWIVLLGRGNQIV